MLEQSDIPLFLCKRLCLDVSLYFYFSFSLEKHTPLNVGLIYDMEHSINEDRYNTIKMINNIPFIIYSERKENNLNK